MMKKILVLLAVTILPINAVALTPDQEFTEKCEMKMTMKSDGIDKSIYSDKRICSCAFEEIKKAGTPEQIQDVADFYSEKYEGFDFHHKNPNSMIIHQAIDLCVDKFFTPKQKAEERAKYEERMEKFKTQYEQQPKKLEFK